MSLNVRPQALIPRYPGSKRRRLPVWARWLDGYRPTVVIEPFGGGLWFTLGSMQSEHPAREYRFAEVQPDLQAIYRCWFLNKQVELRDAVEAWQITFAREDPEKAWALLKEDFMRSGDVVGRASASLCLRKLTMSGVTRDTPGSGELNVRYVKTQLDALQRYTPTLPPLMGEIRMSVDCDLLDWGLAYGDRAIAIIDPPYSGEVLVDRVAPSRRSGKYISPAYVGHRPHEVATRELGVRMLGEAMKHRVQRIIVSNYYSDYLQSVFRTSAMYWGYSMECNLMGKLTGLNNNCRKSKDETPYVDTDWLFVRN